MFFVLLSAHGSLLPEFFKSILLQGWVTLKTLVTSGTKEFRETIDTEWDSFFLLYGGLSSLDLFVFLLLTSLNLVT